MNTPPFPWTMEGKLAAGYTVADVPITIMQSLNSVWWKQVSKTLFGIGSQNITVSFFTRPPQSGQVSG